MKFIGTKIDDNTHKALKVACANEGTSASAKLKSLVVEFIGKRTRGTRGTGTVRSAQ